MAEKNIEMNRQIAFFKYNFELVVGGILLKFQFKKLQSLFIVSAVLSTFMEQEIKRSVKLHFSYLSYN